MLIRSNQAFPNCIPPIAMCAPKSASSSKSSATSASSTFLETAPTCCVSRVPQPSGLRLRVLTFPSLLAPCPPLRPAPANQLDLHRAVQRMRHPDQRADRQIARLILHS